MKGYRNSVKGPIARAVLAGVLAISAGYALGADRELEISVGGSKVIALGFEVQKAEVVDKSVLDVVRTEQPLEVLLKGTRPGTTDVRFFSADGRDAGYRVVVVEDLEKILGATQELLQEIPGIDIVMLGNRVVIRGRLLKPRDDVLVKKVVDLFGPQVVSMAMLDSAPYNASLEGEIRDRITNEIGIKSLKVEIVNEKVQLSGRVYDEQQRKRAQDIASQYDRPVLNLLDVVEASVEIDVVFAKFTTSKEKSIGHNVLQDVTLAAEGQWSGGKNVESDFAWTATARADLSAVLKSFANNGEVRELARPHISAKSGKGGTFHSGGWLYVPLVGSESAELEKIQYGLFLQVTPEIRSENDVNCDIEVSIRAPVEGGAGGAVALNVAEHKIQTSLRSAVNETMILSGVISSMGGESLGGFPILREKVPLLNYFFASKRKRNQEEELIILMTPRNIKGFAATGDATSQETIGVLDKVAP